MGFAEGAKAVNIENEITERNDSGGVIKERCGGRAGAHFIIIGGCKAVKAGSGLEFCWIVRRLWIAQSSLHGRTWHASLQHRTRLYDVTCNFGSLVVL